MTRLNWPMGLTCVLAAIAAQAQTSTGHDAVIEDSFYPYAKPAAQIPGMELGGIISKKNLQQVREYLDPAMAEAVANGWVEISVRPVRSFDIETTYIEATRKHFGKTKLGSAAGDLMGYSGGRPFPQDPQLSDPNAGEKIAWNFRYRQGDGGAIRPIQWKYIDMPNGKVERLLRVEVHVLKYKYRTRVQPLPDVVPNPSNLYFATHLKVFEPADLRNTQLLIQRYDEDTKQDDSYMYMPFQRRVRRLATGQTTDAFLGSDVMIEDFEGYNARISEMRWSFKGTKHLLMPFFNHNEVKLSSEFKDLEGFQYVAFGGQGGCFPDVHWQLRKVYVVEAEPVNTNHPVSRRIFYFDAQTYEIARTSIYDRKDALWKIGILGKAHPDSHLTSNRGSGTPISDAGAMIDVQAKHCSTAQFKSLVQPSLSNPSMFQVQVLRGSD